MEEEKQKERQRQEGECALVEDESFREDMESQCYTINTSGCCLDPCLQPIEQYDCCCC